MQTLPNAWTFWLLLAVVCTGMGAYVAPPDVIRVGAFSEASPEARYPPGWTVYELANGHKQTKYDLVASDQGTVVRARSKGAMANLTTGKERIDLTTHPILEWRWKIDQLAEAANVQKRAQNDLTAAIVVRFHYHDMPLLQRLKHFTIRLLGYNISSHRMLLYFWANEADRGSVSKNLHAGWLRQVAVRSGSDHVGTWVTERRNVLKDYRAVFGEAPSHVTNVSLITETNNTNERVTAYYGDLLFRPAADSLIGPSLRRDRRPN